MTFDSQTAIICCILAAAAGFKNLTGFGFSLCAAPLLALILLPVQIVPLLALLETAIGIWLWRRLSISVPLRQLLWLCAASVVGMLTGTAILVHLNPQWLRLALGVCVILTVAGLWSGRRIPIGASRAAVGSTGLLSGLMGGTTAMSGPPIVLFFDSSATNPEQFRANCIAYFTITYAIQTSWLAGQQMITAETLYHAAFGLAVVMVVLWLSRGWSQRISSAAFRRVCLALLAASGLAAAGLGAAQLIRG